MDEAIGWLSILFEVSLWLQLPAGMLPRMVKITPEPLVTPHENSE
jgi:hypothetical protein